MTNHEQEAERVRIEIYRKMSPADKWRQFCEMYRFAWAVKRAGVREQHPDWTDQQVEDKVREIFLYATT